MSFGTMVTILFTWYFQSLGISLGILPTALLAIPFAIIFMILYMLSIDKFVFKKKYLVLIFKNTINQIGLLILV